LAARAPKLGPEAAAKAPNPPVSTLGGERGAAAAGEPKVGFPPNIGLGEPPKVAGPPKAGAGDPKAGAPPKAGEAPKAAGWPNPEELCC